MHLKIDLEEKRARSKANSKEELELLPQDLAIELEFNKIQLECSKYCFSKLAADQIFNHKFFTDPQLILVLLSELEEMMWITQKVNFPLSEFEALDDDIKLLKIPNYTCTLDAVLRIKSIALISKNVLGFFKNLELTQFKYLKYRMDRIFNPNVLLSLLSKVFSPSNEILDSASADLLRIRRSIKDIQSELYKVFKRSLNTYKEKSYLADIPETIRNGRYVLAVNVENKRNVSGIIHDQSDSGKIIFIEPDELVQLNNRLRELESDEQAEIWKILNQLSEDIRPMADEILQTSYELVGLDVIHAKAKLAILMNATKPKIIDHGLDIKDGRHPLLLLKNSILRKETVPFSLYLNEANRILLISGPNAGGKSITLKALGLLQLMFQNGYLLPVAKNSAMSVFNKIYGDVADHQSLDEGLSTYSAKLKLLKLFDEHTDSKTLLLMDEYGSGTEPRIGGVIAETVLKRINLKGCYGMINSHYSNLKALAHREDGLINGAMLYDNINMRPTFILRVGKPGSSFALELAKTNQLDPNIIKEVKRKIGKDHVALEDLLTNLDEQKLALEKERAEWQEKISKLDQLISNYENLSNQYEVKRLKLKLEAKKLEIKETDDIQRQYVKVAKEIREEKNLEKAMALAEKQKQEQIERIQEFSELNKKLSATLNKGVEYEIKIGSPVKLIKYGLIGRVVSMNKNKLIVEESNLKYNVDISEVVPMPQAMESNQIVRIKLDSISSSQEFKPLLDIRGFRVTDALEAFEIFIDKAILANTKEVKILHGKGSGQLKQAIHKAARSYKFIGGVTHPEESNGGLGVSIMELK